MCIKRVLYKTKVFFVFSEEFDVCPTASCDVRYRRAAAPCWPYDQLSGVGSAGEAEAVGRGSNWRIRAEERKLPGEQETDKPPWHLPAGTLCTLNVGRLYTAESDSMRNSRQMSIR